MNKNQLIQNLKKLNQIQPRKEFIVSAKKEILGESPGFGLFSVLKPVYAGLFCLFMVLGLFQFSQNALPGELMFQLKKITEKAQTMFASEEERPTLSLFLANERLMDLATIAEENQAQKLAPAVNEFKLATVEAAKNLATITEVNEEIIVQVKQFEENLEKIEQVLATKFDTEEIDNALAPIIEREILALEENTLTEEEKEVLKQIKEYFKNGEYSEALMGILNLSHN